MTEQYANHYGMDQMILNKWSLVFPNHFPHFVPMETIEYQFDCIF